MENYMKKIHIILLFLFISVVTSQTALELSEEKHLTNIKQLTFGGENAEAYFSFDEKELIYQWTKEKGKCDQIYIMDVNGNNKKLVSTGKGVTTCAYFMPDNERIIYASTHLGGDNCPPKPDRSKGYVWALYKDYDIFSAKKDGTDLKRLTSTSGYDAEATVSPKGDKIVFTSMRDGDLEIYTMNLDGSNQTRLTKVKGYDGGAFFSPDGKKIIYRAYHPKTDEEIKEYDKLIKENLVKPWLLQLFIMDTDGKNQKQITNNSSTNFAPFMHPDGKRVIFCSYIGDENAGKGGMPNFDLYMINVDGTGLERITYNPTFDGFPMFTRDGKKLVFASNRNGKEKGETNIFIADWKE
jgi:Tol biopolymer transport system component